eukprot:TRINITY_DN1252_c0_g1_i4.p1 TRINITY_DN1252_c0_g1~~TRINITY_DN1252_c0_g1_i4.p1  ORF type:complete len:167 (-),score=8.08 TRINITY_DN1252_c0_g1_i4:1-501(-)
MLVSRTMGAFPPSSRSLVTGLLVATFVISLILIRIFDLFDGRGDAQSTSSLNLTVEEKKIPVESNSYSYAEGGQFSRVTREFLRLQFLKHRGNSSRSHVLLPAATWGRELCYKPDGELLRILEGENYVRAGDSTTEPICFLDGVWRNFHELRKQLNKPIHKGREVH